MKSIWEALDSYTFRLKVPGGWILKAYSHPSYAEAIALIFVSDPNYQWKLE